MGQSFEEYWKECLSLARTERQREIMWRLQNLYEDAWFIVYKEIPDQVDHINHVRNDNRIGNLRNVSPTENGRNKDLCSDNKSGVNGVSWHKRDKRWRAHIVIARKQIHLGNFINKEDAIAARFAADKEIGFHPNHGKIRENEEYNGKCNS